MAKSTTWILIADSAKARLIEQDPDAREFKALSSEAFEGERGTSKEIASDRPGRTFDSGGQGRHAMEPSSDPQRHAKFAFARDLARHLDEADTHQRFDRLILIAAPQTLGDLRSMLPDRVQAKVVREIDKDLTSIPLQHLAKHLDPVLEELRAPGGAA